MSDENERSVASAGSAAGDIVARLRRTVAGSRRWYRNPDGPEAADEIERLRLTGAEREAIKAATGCCEDITYGSESEPEAAAVLRGLLERLK